MLPVNGHAGHLTATARRSRVARAVGDPDGNEEGDMSRARRVAFVAIAVAVLGIAPVRVSAATAPPATGGAATRSGLAIDCARSHGEGLARAQREGLCDGHRPSNAAIPANTTSGNCGVVSFFIWDFGAPGEAQTWLYVTSYWGPPLWAAENMTIYNASLDATTFASFYDSASGTNTLQAYHEVGTGSGFVTIGDTGSVTLVDGTVCWFPPPGQYLWDQAQIS